MRTLNKRIRKFIGTIIIPLWLIFFIATISFLAELIIPGLNQVYLFLFYLISGIIWIVPVLPLISWMQKD